ALAIIMAMQPVLIITIDARLGVIFRAFLDLVAGQGGLHSGVRPVYMRDPVCSEQDFSSAWPPIAGVNQKIAYRPGFVVKNKVFNVSDFTIRSTDMVAVHIGAAAQVGIFRVICRACGNLVGPVFNGWNGC